MSIRACGLVFVVCVAVPALGAPLAVPVDPGQSVLNFQLCVAGQCDTDSSAVGGTVTIELYTVNSPAQMWLYDFDLSLLNNLHFYLSWGIFGNFTADATNVSVHYAYPGTVLGPVPVVGTQFTFVDVPVNAEGTLTYHATGLACTALQGAGLPCDDTQNMADQGTQVADQFSGTVTSANRIVTLANSIDVTTPLDPNNPDLGTLRVWGTVHGQVYVPLYAGDLNCDDAVNNFDITPFVLALSDPAAYGSAYPGCDIDLADINGDGRVDNFDITPFVALLTGQ